MPLQLLQAAPAKTVAVGNSPALSKGLKDFLLVNFRF